MLSDVCEECRQVNESHWLTGRHDATGQPFLREKPGPVEERPLSSVLGAEHGAEHRDPRAAVFEQHE